MASRPDIYYGRCLCNDEVIHTMIFMIQNYHNELEYLKFPFCSFTSSSFFLAHVLLPFQTQLFYVSDHTILSMMFLIPLSPHYPVLIFSLLVIMSCALLYLLPAILFYLPYSFLCFKFAIILLFHRTEVSLESGEFQWEVWWCACFQKQTSFSNLNNSNMWRSILVNVHSQSSLLEIIGKYCLSLLKHSANLCEIAVASAKVDRYIGGRAVVLKLRDFKIKHFSNSEL